MTHYQRNETIQLHQEYEDWAVLFDRQTTQSLVINAVGIVIWRVLMEADTLDGVVKAVWEEFDDAPPEMAEDVREFLTGLVTGGFVSERP